MSDKVIIKVVEDGSVLVGKGKLTKTLVDIGFQYYNDKLPEVSFQECYVWKNNKIEVDINKYKGILHVLRRDRLDKKLKKTDYVIIKIKERELTGEKYEDLILEYKDVLSERTKVREENFQIKKQIEKANSVEDLEKIYLKWFKKDEF